ncbi:hypothetical protein HPB48_018075 [Haemaphysalis longicornis]|uniref:Uncharacterized protein n=1 Tax=Haemaphysalis longicornis TaxID=44386 RepID=A0A9J6FJU5_HAELO|nr:hypothetical protein HPB48_018075 [Haemaphysalis longicornis]
MDFNTLPTNSTAAWKVARRTPYLPEVQVTRYYRSQTNGGRTDCFQISADTRPMAYEAVAYLTLEGENGTRSTTLVSKQRVAPSKEITLARLELVACLLTGRLCGYILEALNSHQTSTYGQIQQQHSIGFMKMLAAGSSSHATESLKFNASRTSAYVDIIREEKIQLATSQPCSWPKTHCSGAKHRGFVPHAYWE